MMPRHPRLMRAALCLLMLSLGVFSLWACVDGYATGLAPSRGGAVSQVTSPILYWIMLTAAAVVGVLLLLFAAILAVEKGVWRSRP